MTSYSQELQDNIARTTMIIHDLERAKQLHIESRELIRRWYRQWESDTLLLWFNKELQDLNIVLQSLQQRQKEINDVPNN